MFLDGIEIDHPVIDGQLHNAVLDGHVVFLKYIPVTASLHTALPALLANNTNVNTAARAITATAPLVAAGTATPFTYSATGLPSGLSINAATGVISGSIPAQTGAGGSGNIAVKVTDKKGGSVTVNVPYTLTVAPYAPKSANLGNLLQNNSNVSSAARAITTTQVMGTLSGSAVTSASVVSGNPASLAFGTNGQVSGSMPAANNSGASGTMTVRITNAAGSYDITGITWTRVVAPYTTLQTSLPALLANNSSVSSAARAITTTTPLTLNSGSAVTYAGTGIPTGLAVSTAGAVSGSIPAQTGAGGSGNIAITATNAAGSYTVNVPYTLTVAPYAVKNANLGNLLQYNTNVNSAARAITSITAFTSRTGSALTACAIQSGNPASLAITTAGVISGSMPAATDAGASGTVTVRLTNAAGTYDVTGITWTRIVAPYFAAFPVKPGSVINVDISVAMSYDVTYSGSAGTGSTTATPRWPAGLALTQASSTVLRLSGTPTKDYFNTGFDDKTTTPGDHHLSITMTNAAGSYQRYCDVRRWLQLQKFAVNDRLQRSSIVQIRDTGIFTLGSPTAVDIGFQDASNAPVLSFRMGAHPTDNSYLGYWQTWTSNPTPIAINSGTWQYYDNSYGHIGVNGPGVVGTGNIQRLVGTGVINIPSGTFLHCVTATNGDSGFTTNMHLYISG
jgi:hypothetical protein